MIWDRSAAGYWLPTEAEWEYACRAGTLTPFNLEKSLDATEANFYGHYPYEIEENYFNDSVLEARPGQYRAKTVEVGSFSPNAWNLYDCHGNVNEWCWDYYGSYNVAQSADPTGPESGTHHVYRGGGWNDFGKNMRSAYRAAGQADLESYNLGVRLVRNATPLEGAVIAQETNAGAIGGKVLIAFFSWSGNTRGIAYEIQRQTGADLFEITLTTPKTAQKRIDKKAAEVAAAVLAGKRSEKRPPKEVAFELMSKGLGRTHAKRIKKFAANDSCIGCGTCEKICPRNNIQLVEGKPRFGPNCIGCLSCVQFCPKQAINIGKITEKRERFPNPNIKPGELTEKIIHIP